MVGNRRSYYSSPLAIKSSCCDQAPAIQLPTAVVNNNNDNDDEDSALVTFEEEDEEGKYPFIGMIPRICKDLFKRISVLNNSNNNNTRTWIVSIGFIEIY